MSILRSLIPRRSASLRASAGQPLPFDEWTSMFSFGNGFWPVYGNALGSTEEEITHEYTSLMSAMISNGVVYACELVRVMLFSEARFLFRQRRSGHPGELFGTEALRVLEKPDGPGSTTASMMKRAMLHADYGGTGFMVRKRDRIWQPRPDWMTVVLGSERDPELGGDALDAEVVGYTYHPGGYYSGERPVTLLPSEVATFTPMPDSIAKVRGVPWTAAARRYVMGHNAATTHKLKFFENGATPQMIVSLDLKLDSPEKLRQWIEVIEQDHKGSTNAYKTLYLAAGAKADVVGKDLQQLDFKATQGADETLIAAAAGVGPVVAQLSEGLQGSSLNAGNFAQAMRRVADITMRPLWRDMAGSLEVLVPPPPASELWYDDSDVPALKDDIKDRAEVQGLQATVIRTLSDGGFEPDSVIESVVAGDWKRLVHTGQLSVQLQEPGAEPAPRQIAATATEVPLLAAGETYEVRCTGVRRDGSPCGALLGKRTSPDPVGFERKCDRCGTLVAA